MAISHALSGEAVDIRPLGSRLIASQTIALFKSKNLEVMRLVLPKGKGMPLHSVQGDITMQCIEGSIAVVVDGQSKPLDAGQLMYLSGGVEHSLTAVADASVLVTIAFCR
jgi:quercetin dioxygenase-like cupin family protein